MARLKPESRGTRSAVITSRQNATVREYRRLARTRRREDPRSLVDGLRLLQEAIAAGVRVVSAAFTADVLSSMPDAVRLAGDLSRAGAQVITVSDVVMAALSPVRSPSGVAAIVEREAPGLERLFAAAPALVVIASDVQDPGNVGAVIRAAEAGGATGVLFCGASADPFSWKGLRGAMGSAFRLPVVTTVSVVDAVDAARRHGLAVLAAIPRGGRFPSEIDLTGPIAVMLGGEGAGLPADVAALADDRISIPMRAPVESLNVAVASALLVYEALRQRSFAGAAAAPATRARPGARDIRRA